MKMVKANVAMFNPNSKQKRNTNRERKELEKLGD